jgi:outer membrane protein
MSAGRLVLWAAVIVAAGAPRGFAQGQNVVRLSLSEAEQQAVRNHPAIRAGEYSALAAGETVRQVRSAYLPSVYGSFTGAQAQNGSIITAGGLNNSSVIDRFAYGFSASQLLTDFGRTSNLSASASLRVDAQQQDVEARRATVLLELDRAYFDALRARAVERVAEQTVTARQLVVDQVTALAASGLKSTLDLSFAKVNLAEARLLLVQAKNDVNASDARLSAALGGQARASYELADEPLSDAPPTDASTVAAHALANRPDLAQRRLAGEASLKFADAERSLWWPTLSLVGAAGMTPFHQVGIQDRYSAVGLNVTVPITNGNLFAARRAEAAFRASADQQTVKDLETRVTRDVEIALLDAQTAYQRLDLTNQLLAQSTDALDLAQQRYDLGLSSIVELTQAQLNQTRAQIEQATARYEYLARRSALRYQTGDLK